MDLVLDGDALVDPTRVGHKFARQEVLRRAGFPVPEFFCVPVEAFDEAVARTPDADGIRAAGVPAELVRAVLERFDELAGPDGLVAVRACVVADSDGGGEDSARDPFAGLSDSFLYVRREDVPGRIADCWASAFNPEAVLYRTHRGIDPRSARVAVGVQRMVLGLRSFVAFSRDPRDGGDRCVIAAAHGIGEGVVAERADIDHFYVDENGVRAEIVRKTRMVGHGSLPAEVPAELRDPPVLTDATAVRISELARDVAAYFGAPQDIEGTITADGMIHLLQARPVVLPAERAEWTNHNVTESFPGLTCALTFSQAQVFYRETFADFYRRMGVPAPVLRANEHHLRRMIALLDHRVYYRLDSWHALHDRLPGFGFLRPTWERSLGISDPGGAHRVRPRDLLRSLPRLALLAIRHPLAHRAFLRWWDGFAAEQQCDGDAETLVRTYRTMWAEAGRRWGVTIVNSYFALVLLAIAERLVAPELMIGLLSGGPENRSLRALRSAIALSELVRANPRLCCDVLALDERRVWAMLMDGGYGEAERAAFSEHLRRYGDRTVHDLKLETLTPRQQPWLLLTTLRPLITARMTVAGSVADEKAAYRQARERLRETVRGPLRRAAVRVVTRVLRGLVKAREDARFCRSELYGRSRQILWRLGGMLAAGQRLDDASEVVHLTVDEVLGAFDGTLIGEDLRGLAAHRAWEMALEGEHLPLPPHFTTEAGACVANALPAHRGVSSGPLDGVKSLRGIASSSGRVRGEARVVLDPAAPGVSCDGKVLVARETDPGWLFLMLTATAMVVERGSPVSHTAITGRMLGIPTVVGVEGATRLIKTGDQVEVDGGAGTVWLDA
ncbi:phosphoenolpyruvate synthase [Lentzea sp. NBRC 105346]|uniref:PEP/pyruvate-binding domain-containing protein n=1 Tax=Lentzea sp. NBRC 105346 TaxID=3032205 RepID=UPI0024A2DB71|nr:PEP/pyruvate-binding domain-containing protein [Lentzea sp. NBRC 105346]GLZ29812.1 phosphoenolpyruvate synthase [Lentzea sp. NBRC 105346]